MDTVDHILAAWLEQEQRWLHGLDNSEGPDLLHEEDDT